MHIVFQIHHADVSDALQQKAARALEKLGARLRRVEGATVRIAADRTLQRVELNVRLPRRPALVAVGTGRQVEGALGEALAALEAQVAHERASRARRIRRLYEEGGRPRPARAARAVAPATLLLTMDGGAEGALEA